MTYSFAAIQAIDTINDHGGFYAVATICGAVATLCLMASDDVDELRVYLLMFAVMVAIAAGVSYNTGSVTTFANEQVTATLVGFQAEGYNISEQHGKTTRQVDHHETYIVYAVPGGNVMFPAATGQIYPKTAILYKN